MSNGQGNQRLIIDWRWAEPKLVEMGWDAKQYEIRACYAESETPQIAEGIIVGVDLGEIHLAVAHDGVQANLLTTNDLS